MRLLLDTHVFIWASAEPARLSPAQRAAIAAAANVIFVSPIVAWEIATKAALGRLGFSPGGFETIRAGMGFEPLPVTIAHGLEAGGLPLYHRDPFDRMLIAQARTEGLTLATSDRVFRQYAVPLLN